MEHGKKYKEGSRKTKRFSFTSKFIGTFLESSSDEDESYVNYYISNFEAD